MNNSVKKWCRRCSEKLNTTETSALKEEGSEALRHPTRTQESGAVVRAVPLAITWSLNKQADFSASYQSHLHNGFKTTCPHLAHRLVLKIKWYEQWKAFSEAVFCYTEACWVHPLPSPGLSSFHCQNAGWALRSLSLKWWQSKRKGCERQRRCQIAKGDG